MMNFILTSKFDQFLLSSDLSVYKQPIVAYTFIRKSISRIILVEIPNVFDDLELWPVIVVDRVRFALNREILNSCFQRKNNDSS